MSHNTHRICSSRALDLAWKVASSYLDKKNYDRSEYALGDCYVGEHNGKNRIAFELKHHGHTKSYTVIRRGNKVEAYECGDKVEYCTGLDPEKGKGIGFLAGCLSAKRKTADVTVSPKDIPEELKDASELSIETFLDVIEYQETAHSEPEKELPSPEETLPPETGPDIEPDTETEPERETEPEVTPETGTETETAPETEPEMEAEGEGEPEPTTEEATENIETAEDVIEADSAPEETPIETDVPSCFPPELCNDIDLDGIPNALDNCRELYNPSQLDLNKDGIGDECQFDVDNDGVASADDNCVYVSNPDQADGDYNGVGDLCDIDPCNGIDDDNDGLTDEDLTGIMGQECSNVAGECQTFGKYICAGTSGETICSAPPITLKAESCNGIDDDCDGKTDEGFNLGAACTNGTGACKTSGKIACAPSGLSECNAVPNPPFDEICNGIDDDCDGVTDNSFGVGEICYDGIGACMMSGKIYCLGGEGACSAVAGAPTPEVCDGIDNDCDSLTDEELGTIECGIGECRNSTPSCIGGVDQICTPKPVKAEVCDRLDNNCNGATDEIGGAVKDLDGDGICNEIDDDVDGDGKPNSLDNCPSLFNPDQSDWDRDNLGDICDPSCVSMKLFVVIESGEDAAAACANTPRLFVTHMNGALPADSGWNSLLNKDNINNLKMTDSCMNVPVALDLEAEKSTWNQTLKMIWNNKDTSGGKFCISRIWMMGTVDTYKARIYQYKKNADGSCDKSENKQQFAYPQYDKAIITECP